MKTFLLIACSLILSFKSYAETWVIDVDNSDTFITSYDIDSIHKDVDAKIIYAFTKYEMGDKVLFATTLNYCLKPYRKTIIDGKEFFVLNDNSRMLSFMCEVSFPDEKVFKYEND